MVSAAIHGGKHLMTHRSWTYHSRQQVAMLINHLGIILYHALQTGKDDGCGLGGVTAFPQSLVYLTMPILVGVSVCLTEQGEADLVSPAHLLELTFGMHSLMVHGVVLSVILLSRGRSVGSTSDIGFFFHAVRIQLTGQVILHSIWIRQVILAWL